MIKTRLPLLFLMACLTVSGPPACGDTGDAEFSESLLFTIAGKGDSDFTIKTQYCAEKIRKKRRANTLTGFGYNQELPGLA